MKWRRDARDKRHFIIMSAVAALVLVIGLFFDQNGEQAVETSGTQTVTVREGAVTDAAVMAAPISEAIWASWPQACIIPLLIEA